MITRRGRRQLISWPFNSKASVSQSISSTCHRSWIQTATSARAQRPSSSPLIWSKRNHYETHSDLSAISSGQRLLPLPEDIVEVLRKYLHLERPLTNSPALF